MSAPDFTVDVFQNEYLPDGAREVNAIVTVTSAGSAAEGMTGPASAAEIIIVDCSLSMATPWKKLIQARRATAAAIDVIRDGSFEFRDCRPDAADHCESRSIGAFRHRNVYGPFSIDVCIGSDDVRAIFDGANIPKIYRCSGYRPDWCAQQFIQISAQRCIRPCDPIGFASPHVPGRHNERCIAHGGYRFLG